MGQDQNQDETPTQVQIIRNAIEQRLVNVHTALPGKLLKVDGSKGDVQIELQRKLIDDTLIKLPVITNVPIVFPRNKTSGLSLPTKVGDTGLVLFSERSLDLWLLQGGNISPNSARKFDLSDGCFVPGLYPFSEPPQEFDGTKLFVYNEKAKVELSPDGTVEIKNDTGTYRQTPAGKFALTNGTEELLDLVDQLLDALLAARTNTILGPQPLVPPSLFSTIKTKLATLKE